MSTMRRAGTGPKDSSHMCQGPSAPMPVVDDHDGDLGASKQTAIGLRPAAGAQIIFM